MFNNRADSALKDVVIHDVIPGAFELLEWKVVSSTGKTVDCDMVEDATTDGKKMSWNIGTVSRGERIEVTYEFKGDSETGFKVSDAQEIHGIDVGAEIEDDEPPETLPMTESQDEDENVETSDEDEHVDAEEDSEEDASEDSDDQDDDVEAGDDEIVEESDNADEEEAEDDAEEATEDTDDDTPSQENHDDDDDQMDAALAKLTGGAEDESSDDIVEAKTCPICNVDVAPGMMMCPVCSYTF